MWPFIHLFYFKSMCRVLLQWVVWTKPFFKPKKSFSIWIWMKYSVGKRKKRKTVNKWVLFLWYTDTFDVFLNVCLQVSSKWTFLSLTFFFFLRVLSIFLFVWDHISVVPYILSYYFPLLDDCVWCSISTIHLFFMFVLLTYEIIR